MKKNIIRRCPDVWDSLKMAEQLKKEYSNQGYEVVDLMLGFFKLMLDDGYVLIGWENGAFYSRCFTY